MKERRAGPLGAALALAVTGWSVNADEWKAPDAERTRTNPMAAAPAALQKGRALYQKHCVPCPCRRGRGDGPAAPFNAEKPPDLTDPERQQALTDGEVLWKITTGRKVEDEILMPAMAGLAAPDDPELLEDPGRGGPLEAGGLRADAQSSLKPLISSSALAGSSLS